MRVGGAKRRRRAHANVPQPLALKLPAMPPPPSQRKVPIVGGIKNLLSAGPALPSVAERVKIVLRDIDPNDAAVVIWVPGTTEHFIKPHFLEAARKELPGLHVTMIPYEASWRLTSSVPDGAKVLRGVIEALRARGDKRPIMLAGESQGAWVISSVLADPKLAKQVARTSVWGHPAAAPQVYGRSGKVREVNDPNDLVSKPLGPRAGDVIEAVEQISRLNLLSGVATLASVAVRRPSLVTGLVGQWLWAMPLVGKSHSDPHAYHNDFAQGARFMAQALPPAAATPARRRRRAQAAATAG